MKELTLNNIAKACGGTLFLYDSKKEDGNKQTVTCAVIDSRLIEPGGLFIATRGERVDGHKFIPGVWEAGALCVIAEEDLFGSEFCPEGIQGNYIVVEDSLKALRDIARFYRTRLSIPVVGVTGSVGKTSTKEMIASVLSQKYDVLKTEGNFNNEIGLPLTVLSIRDHHEAAVLEMGISDFGEMTVLSEIAKPDICVITNIGPCHLEFLGDLDGVLRAKTEIFLYRNKNGAVILNGKDEKLKSLWNVDGTTPTFFGTCLSAEEKQEQKDGTSIPKLDVYATDVVGFGLEGSGCMIHTPIRDFPVRVPLPGVHMVDNCLAATAVGLAMDMSIEKIRDGIMDAKGMRGRSNLIHTSSFLLVDDCYNANPKAMRSAIDLMQNAVGRKVAILGDMFELGEDSAAMHASVGEYAKDKVDVLICCGELSKNMYEAALSGRQKTMWFEKREELEEALLNTSVLHTDDTILIKASHGMGFEKIVELLSGL